MPDTFSLTSNAIPTDARVVTFRGSEQLSRLYRFDVQIMMSHAASEDFDLASAVGAVATLAVLDGEGGARMKFHGVLAQVEFVADLSGDAIYRAELVPRFWRLTQSLHSRVYIGKSVSEIVQSALLHGGLAAEDFELQLSRTYHPIEHVCQYRESDFDFVSRWMEREGIYYYFEHGESQDKLIITDSMSRQQPFASQPIRYFPQGGSDGTTVEALHAFTCRHRALPNKVHLQDYDYQRPDTPVVGDAHVSNGSGEVHLFGENFTDANEGRRLASVRAQELTARQVVYEGRGRSVNVRTGYTFSLEEHPRSAFNRSYLVTAVEHVGNQFAGSGAADVRRALESIDVDGLETGDETYGVRIRAIADDVQFRPERTTPWPRIYGTEIGVIDGAITSDHAQIDADGRYLVKVLFDESDLRDGTASMRLRMIQPHGGNPEGFHFPLRKGTEVMLTFLGGDPDRPVIVGVVPNAQNPSPVTQDNHMLNVIHTGGNNHIEISDIPGKEYIKFKTPHARTVFHIGARHNPSAEKYSATDGSSKSIVTVDQVAFVGHSRCAVIGEATSQTTTASTEPDAASKLPVDVAGLRDLVLIPFTDTGGTGSNQNPSLPSGTSASEAEGFNSTTSAANPSAPASAFEDITTSPVVAGSDIKLVASDYWSYLGRNRVALVAGNQFTRIGPGPQPWAEMPTTLAPGDQFTHIVGHQTANVDRGKDATITGDYTSTVTGDRNNTVNGHKSVIVGSGQDSTITGDQVSTVNGNQTSTINGHKSSTVTGGQDSTIHGDQRSDLYGHQQANVWGHKSALVTNGQDSTVSGGSSSLITGGQINQVDWQIAIVAAMKIGITVGLDFSLSGFKLSTAVFTYSFALCKIQTHDAHLQTAGIHMMY